MLKKEKILSGLGRKRIGLYCNLGRSLEHYCLSYTFAFRVLLSGEGECGQYQYLALGCSLLFGRVLDWLLG